VAAFGVEEADEEAHCGCAAGGLLIVGFVSEARSHVWSSCLGWFGLGVVWEVRLSFGVDYVVGPASGGSDITSRLEESVI
jgi:hypothetical protein